jgi:hypothetical protein
MDAVYEYDYVKEYWDRFYPTVESAEDEPRRFVNPGEDGSTVRVPEYLAQLDDRAIREVLNRRYRVLPGRERYPRTAMFKAMVWRRVIGERSLLAFHRLLEDSPFEALELGFRYDANTGQVLVPSYQWLWCFSNERFDVQALEELLDVLVRENVKLAKLQGVPVGKRTATDATPLQTCRYDPAGEWNGHYKRKMVKVVLTEDVGTWLPLSCRVIGGNDAEGEELVPMLEEVRERVGPGTMRDTLFDGGFTSNENLAVVHAELGLRAHYKISRGWVAEVRFPRDGPGVRTPVEEVERLYERLNGEDWYVPGESLEYKMRCMVKAGKHEPVAMHFRNAYMAEYEEAPDSVLDDYHARNNAEGVNGHIKDQWDLERTLNVVGVEAVKRHVLWALVSAHVVALVRLQHGVVDNLLSITHIL